MPFYIDIPCKPVVRQYIHNKYGNPVVFPNNDWLAQFFVKCLERPDNNYGENVSMQYYTETVSFPISIRQYRIYGNTITKTDIRFINEFIQDIINENIYNWLEIHFAQHKIILDEAIDSFRKKYNIPEESYSTAAIIKFYQRRRKNNNVNKC